MKKLKTLLITLAITLLLNAVCFALILTPINETLPASGETPVLVQLGASQSCSDYAVQARGSVDIKISDTSAMTTYWTIKSGSAVSLNQILGKGAKMFYAVSGSTADTIEILPLQK